VVEERDNSGNAVDRYVWSPVYVDGMVLRDRDADGNSGNGLEERVYVTQDANWNVTALVNTSGSVVERTVYDSYGRFDFKDASWGTRSSSSYAWVYLHQGGRYDATAALFNFRNRDYSPTLMRWVSVDPIGFKARDMDFYRYERDQPVNLTDPRGLSVQIAPVDSARTPQTPGLCCKPRVWIASRPADAWWNLPWYSPFWFPHHFVITLDANCNIHTYSFDGDGWHKDQEIDAGYTGLWWNVFEACGASPEAVEDAYRNRRAIDFWSLTYNCYAASRQLLRDCGCKVPGDPGPPYYGRHMIGAGPTLK
jgi:RHS repeat-associated protein